MSCCEGKPLWAMENRKEIADLFRHTKDIAIRDKKELLYLAELIDPPTCHDTRDDDWQVFECSECGTIVEHNVDEHGELIYSADTWKDREIKYCPYCGAKVEE